MAVDSPVTEPAVDLALSSSQVQQLIQTNEALLKTNESLKEMVISVIDLLRDPTRHATYGDASQNSESNVEKNQHVKPSPTLPSERSCNPSPSSSSRRRSQELPHKGITRGSAYEKEVGAVLGEVIYPMTFDEIEEETASYRERYEGKSFQVMDEQGQVLFLSLRETGIVGASFYFPTVFPFHLPTHVGFASWFSEQRWAVQVCTNNLQISGKTRIDLSGPNPLTAELGKMIRGMSAGFVQGRSSVDISCTIALLTSG